ncbi:MAG: patatin-like phospholipase family protein [Pseudomonadota bacterium]|nr:patatin-like phospholipase family protein [Pseudomonadota bacterium]
MGNQASRFALAWVLTAGCAWCFAADATAAPPDLVRPRICLVLSGGGARGMAHIGVLKVLEDLKIPIDCIAGTSMGAVVGGLYASGMSAHDIESTMRSVDWQEAFRDAPPRRDLAFRRKQDDRNFLVRLPLGLKHGEILLPKGFIQGQKLQETLRQLTLPFSNSTDFDRLPTPFRAVATDLEDGNAVLLDKGDLAIAMRASISAPGVFAPVEYQGRLLVDGGLAENLPINVARGMNADILIVSDVSFPLLERTRLDSAITISNQMLAILVRKDSERQKSTLSAQDVLIEPVLGPATSTDFTAGVNTIAQGEEAARGVADRLAALGVDDAVYRSYVARRAAREPELRPIEFFRVDGESKRYEKTILAEMKPLVGKPLNVNEVGKRITELYGLGNFETLDYSLVEQPHGTPGVGTPGAAVPAPGAPGVAAAGATGESGNQESGLEIHARRKSWGPNYIRFGLNLDDDFQGSSHYNAAARFVLSEINDFGAELLTDVQVGSDPRVVSEFYQPLDPLRKWFVAPSARIEARDLPIYSRNSEIADFRDREAESDLDVGRTLGNWGEIRVGLHRISGLTRARFGESAIVEPLYNIGEYFFKFSYDQIDNVHFPREGQTFTFQWDADRTNLGSDVRRDRVSADWLVARSRGRNTLVWWTSAGSTIDGNISPTAIPQFYSLGGFFNLSGLAPRSLTGPHYAIARAIYLRKIGRGGEGFFDFPTYIGASLEMGNTWEQRGAISEGSARKDASIFFAIDTFLGPVYLGSGYDERGTSAFYLFLGRTF